MAKTVRKRAVPRTITFQIDDVALEALGRLEATAAPGVLRPRSSVIRAALIEAARRLDAKGGK